MDRIAAGDVDDGGRPLAHELTALLLELMDELDSDQHDALLVVDLGGATVADLAHLEHAAVEDVVAVLNVARRALLRRLAATIRPPALAAVDGDAVHSFEAA